MIDPRTRWERVLDTKPVPVLDQLIIEVAKLFAKELAVWPPKEVALDDQVGTMFTGAVDPQRSRPSPAVYREAFRLTRWELARELDAYDDYMRNRRWQQAGLAPDDKTMLLFLSRWLLEQMLGLTEATEGRVNRAALAEIVDQTERLLNLE